MHLRSQLRFLAALLSLCAGAAYAQYPAKPISLIVPFPAASDADLAARNLAQHAPKYLGGPSIVVMNRPGASGAIGTMAVRNAPPDGYTLLLARVASHAILPAQDSKTPYRPTDFTMLSVLEVNPYVCAVGSAAPYRTMKELVDEMRRYPGKLNFSTAGAGTLQNLGPQYLMALVGLPADAAVGIHYKGSGDLVASLLGGQVQFACNNLGTLLPHVQSGALRALMTTTRERLPELPDVPTARSLGWPDMERLAAWSALMGPPGMSGEIVQRWTDTMVRLAKDADWLAGNAKLGGIPAVRSPQDTERFVREQHALYEKLVARLGLRE